MNRSELEQIFSNNFDAFLSEWKEFLRFKSVSTDNAYADDCNQCANWVKSRLEAMGFKSEIVPTSGKPAVFAERKGERAPTVLFYGHYDVQPVDPIDLWTTDPFDPVVREGRLYARGAQDNKGQVHYVLKALETLISMGALKCGVKILLEGEEECGSPGITEALPKLKDRLKSDILMVCDTGTVASHVASITMGLRGVLHLEIKLGGLTRDLHSGVHGGLVKNPAVEMSRLLATLHDSNGKIAIKGFYDEVAPISEEDRTLANAFDIPPDYYKNKIGVLPLGGERGVPFMERRGFRPTVEVNGLYSGYQGQGSKTIIPSFAVAKITSRIVAKQDPERTLQKILDHLKSHAPEGLEYEVVHAAAGGEALLLSSKEPLVQKVRTILDEIMGTPAVFLWEGASIPLIPSLMEASGGTPILVGFGLEEDNIHAPNESFALEQYKRGFLYAGMFLGSL